VVEEGVAAIDADHFARRTNHPRKLDRRVAKPAAHIEHTKSRIMPMKMHDSRQT
jgi:hypothetical protein